MADKLHGENLTEEEKFLKRMQFLIIADKMKSIYRQTQLADKSRRETDAEHSWHLALYAYVLADYAPEGTDISRTAEMTIVHDLVEIYAGDTFCYDANANADKAQREKESADRLFAVLPQGEGEHFRALWEEFDAQETPDARFAASLDRFQPVINNFLTDFPTWLNGGVTAEKIRDRTALVQSTIEPAGNMINQIIEYARENGYFENR